MYNVHYLEHQNQRIFRVQWRNALYGEKVLRVLIFF